MNLVPDIVLVPFISDGIPRIRNPSLEIRTHIRIIRRKISVGYVVTPKGKSLKFYCNQIRQRDLDTMIVEVLNVSIRYSIQNKNIDTLPCFDVFRDDLKFSRIYRTTSERLCQDNPPRIRNCDTFRQIGPTTVGRDTGRNTADDEPKACNENHWLHVISQDDQNPAWQSDLLCMRHIQRR